MLQPNTYFLDEPAIPSLQKQAARKAFHYNKFNTNAINPADASVPLPASTPFCL
jgi:hypothetical protein